MQGKEKREKRDVLKKHSFLAEEVAEVAGCSKSYVKALRRNARPASTVMAKKVEIAETTLEIGRNLLLDEVKRIIKPL